MARRHTPRIPGLGLRPGRLGLIDILRESYRSVFRDLARSLLAALGTLLGCAAFVATLGLTGTASHQVSSQFDARRATEVSVTAAPPTDPSDADTALAQWYTPASVARADTISGVLHGGRISIASAVSYRRLFLPESDPVPVDSYGVDDGALAAIAPKVIAGRTFDSGHVKRADSVVMLSKTVADRLGIAAPGPAIFVGDTGLTVIGIYADVNREPGAQGALLLPITFLERSEAFRGAQIARKILLETAPGAATQVGDQAAVAVAPTNPSSVTIVAPPDPLTLRQAVEGSVTLLSLVVSVVILLIGAISIASTTAVRVVLRTPEIGLRRALGARRVDIFWQLVGESAGIGLLGGAAGALAGTVVTIVVSVANHWVPIIDPTAPLLAVAAGIVAGILAGIHPGIRATKISPARALTR